ncbi:Hypothetical Protein FCC1311_063912 [Hondaea fermentalgiana]|uniref:Uncharacterized protein n=1 Tax=Hondaea fermentalgiana TaxID=2315210 RepID=A0A2R5GPB7_9STRA|nr:Hypothetical Protein FCC1311_063912 [Hondaea fermentalgiana]|eukprot:GBG30171.1 Hypothetical Protein FCC1311_063912 [Hondaea fermentalgiana]
MIRILQGVNGDLRFWSRVMAVTEGINIIGNNLYDVSSSIYYYAQDAEVSYMLVLATVACVLQLFATMIALKYDVLDSLPSMIEAILMTTVAVFLGPGIVAANFGNDLYPFARNYAQAYNSTETTMDEACAPTGQLSFIFMVLSGGFMGTSFLMDAYGVYTWPSKDVASWLSMGNGWAGALPLASTCLMKLVVLLPIGSVYVFRSYFPLLSLFVSMAFCETTARVLARLQNSRVDWVYATVVRPRSEPISLAEHFSVFFGRFPSIIMGIISLLWFVISIGADGGIGWLGDNPGLPLCTPFGYTTCCWVFFGYVVYLHLLYLVCGMQGMAGTLAVMKMKMDDDLVEEILLKKRRGMCFRVIGDLIFHGELPNLRENAGADATRVGAKVNPTGP